MVHNLLILWQARRKQHTWRLTLCSMEQREKYESCWPWLKGQRVADWHFLWDFIEALE